MKNSNFRKPKISKGFQLVFSLLVILLITLFNEGKDEIVLKDSYSNKLNSVSMKFLGEIHNDSIESKYIVGDELDKPEIQVSVNLKEVEREQQSVDEGHSPWKLDPVYVAQVFVSLKISPKGIQGDYPIKYDDFSLVKNNGKEAVVQVRGDKTPIEKVYLKRFIKQDNTGIWTVVGYNPKK